MYRALFKYNLIFSSLYIKLLSGFPLLLQLRLDFFFSVTLKKIAVCRSHLELSWWLRGKASACSAGDTGSIPGPGRPPGGGQDNPLQYSYLENLMDRRTWWATDHRVAKSWTEMTETHA